MESAGVNWSDVERITFWVFFAIAAAASVVAFLRQVRKKGIVRAFLFLSGPSWPLDIRLDPNSFEAKAEALRMLAADRETAAKNLIKQYQREAPAVAREIARQFEGITDVACAMAWRDIATRAESLLGRSK